MDPYSTQGWNEFFVAGAGAAAALTGLVFVALSINLASILAFPGLPQRAAGALAILTQGLILCLLGLVPQSTDALAAEVLAVTIVGGVVAVRALLRQKPGEGEGPTRAQALGQRAIVIATAVSLLATAVSLWAGEGGGLYWLVVGLLLLLLNGIVNAWVLLVEIQR